MDEVQPPQGHSQFEEAEIRGTHFIDLGRMKG